MPIGLYTAELNFETLKEIGQQGRNSEVFLAHDKQLDGEIVVKKIEKKKLSHPIEYYTECKILYASSHPNVVRINYGCSDADYIYIAMPFYKNGSLKTLIESKHLTIRETIRYSIQFLSGLHNIHSKGLLHLDIKPDNILLSDSDEALISDFGLSKAMDSLGVCYQPNVYFKHLPPEALSSTERTVQFDIYLAGLTLYRMLNGNEHFYSQLFYTNQQDYLDAVIAGNFPNRSSYLQHVPLKLQRVINTALNVDPKERHKSVLELINDLSAIDEQLDWRYEKVGMVETWTKKLEDKIISLILDSTNNLSPKLSAQKTMLATGRIINIRLIDNNNITAGNVTSKVRKALKEL